MIRRAATSLSFAAFFALVLPLQTLLGNRGDYAFGVWRLAGEQLVATAALFAVAFALFWLSDRFARGWLTPVAIGFMAAAYLESGPLSFGLPEINGELPKELGNVQRAVWDAVVWAGVFAASAAVFRMARERFHLVAAGILVLGAASLFDVRPADDAVGESRFAGEGGLAISSEIVANVEYSPSRNVLLFVLDTMPATVAADIVAADPALAAKFPGFVAYRDKIGMHDCTKRGVPSLMTGKYYEAGGNTPEYMMSVFGPDSILQTFRDHGDAIYCICDVLSYGFTTAKTEGKAPLAGKTGIPAVLSPATEIPYMSILDVVFYRVAPFAAKEKILFQKLHSRKMLEAANEHFVNEHVMYPELASKPVSSDPRQMFGKFHTFGSHMPLMFDCDGNPVKEKRRDEQVLRQAVSNALVHLSRLMDAYREKGIYDSSFIVATTDHGSKLAPHDPDSHGQASALLWVKADGATGPFEISSLATSHSKIAPLLKAACAGPLDRAGIDGILHTKDRLFRYIERKNDNIVYDWIFHEDGTMETPKNGRPSR